MAEHKQLRVIKGGWSDTLDPALKGIRIRGRPIRTREQFDAAVRAIAEEHVQNCAWYFADEEGICFLCRLGVDLLKAEWKDRNKPGAYPD